MNFVLARGLMHDTRYNPAESIRMKVYATKSDTKIVDLVQSVLECLNPVQGTDHVLKQLWLETQWLKTTVRDSRIVLPNSFHLILFEVARGAHPVINRFPILRQRVEALARALEPIID